MALARFASFVSLVARSCTSRPPVTLVSSRGFRDKDVLKLRCKDCRFEKVDDRWWVLCDTHGRHKQRQDVPDPKVKWVVTHVTIGHRPFQKKEEAYICGTCPPAAYDYKRKIFYKPAEPLPRKLRMGLHRKFLVPPYHPDKWL